jgi:putative hydrolase of the HAD superfamily
MIHCSPDSNRIDQIEFLYFDLDGTLWDHHVAEERALIKLCDRLSWPTEQFVPLFKETNLRCWREIVQGKMTREELRARRFSEPLTELKITYTESDLVDFSALYLDIYVQTPSIIHGADVCRKLAENYRLGILTNGFKKVQLQKLAHFDFMELFDPIICSEDAEAMKPDPAIFNLASERAGVPHEKIALIGDDHISDIGGATKAGWLPIHYHPGYTKAEVMAEPNADDHCTITTLDDLLELF